MKKLINQEHIEGRVYDYSLNQRIVDNPESKVNGVTYINGTVDIATDEDCLNIVQISYTFVKEKTSAGKPNATYKFLESLMNGEYKTVLEVGAENAVKVEADTKLGIGDWYTERDGEETLITFKKNLDGFIKVKKNLVEDNPEKNPRNRFEVDMLINGVNHVEADPDRNIDADYLVVKGAVFDDYRKTIMPVELTVESPEGIAYFESLDASSSNLVFSKVWGKIVSQNVKKEKTEESAFGTSALVKESYQTVKKWIITGGLPPYEFGDEKNGITADEVKQMLADRETYLAKEKERQTKAKENQNSGSAVTAKNDANAFNF